MEIIKNKKLNAEKHFVLRQIENKTITKEVGQQKILELNKQISINLQEALELKKTEIKTKIVETKKKVFSDGELKRQIAVYLKSLLEDNFTETEIKGIFRAGYKIARGF